METHKSYHIGESAWPVKQFIIKRDTKKFSELTPFFTESYTLLYGALQQNGLPMPPSAYAIYFNINESGEETDLAAAVEVPVGTPSLPGVDTYLTPAAKVINTLHKGPYNDVMAGYQEMDKYLSENGLERQLVIEEYLNDPSQVAPEDLLTGIYYLLK